MSLRTAQNATPEAIENLAKLNIDQAVRIKQLEAMILGLIEAQRPLLEEWTKLTANTESKYE